MVVTRCEKVAPRSARTPGRQQVLRGSGGLVLQCGDGCSVALMPSATRKEYNKLQSLAEAAARPVNSKASSLIHGPHQPPPLPRSAGDATSRSRVVGSPPPHSLPTPVTSGRRIDSATPSTATAPREGRCPRNRRIDAARKRHEAAMHLCCAISALCVKLIGLCVMMMMRMHGRGRMPTVPMICRRAPSGPDARSCLIEMLASS